MNGIFSMVLNCFRSSRAVEALLENFSSTCYKLSHPKTLKKHLLNASPRAGPAAVAVKAGGYRYALTTTPEKIDRCKSCPD
jgi:hypothetical protein